MTSPPSSDVNPGWVTTQTHDEARRILNLLVLSAARVAFFIANISLYTLAFYVSVQSEHVRRLVIAQVITVLPLAAAAIEIASTAVLVTLDILILYDLLCAFLPLKRIGLFAVRSHRPYTPPNAMAQQDGT